MQTVGHDDPAAQFTQATALLSQGKAAEAIECLQRAVAIRPDYAEAHLMLAQALRSWAGSPSRPRAWKRASR